MMPVRKLLTLPHEEGARPFFAETVNLVLPVESDVLGTGRGAAKPCGIPKKKLH
jgi:hypothetical protein